MYTIMIGDTRENALKLLGEAFETQKVSVLETRAALRDRAATQLVNAYVRAKGLVEQAGELDLISINLQGNLIIANGEVQETDHFYVGIKPVG